MITKAKATSGFSIKLDALKGRAYTFKPGLNILFGPNGCGKTTLLKILGAYSGTEAGWSRFLDPSIGDDGRSGFPKRFARQVSLWTEVLPGLAARFQVIAATHCPFALHLRDGLIEMTPGYAEECRAAIGRIEAFLAGKV